MEEESIYKDPFIQIPKPDKSNAYDVRSQDTRISEVSQGPGAGLIEAKQGSI